MLQRYTLTLVACLLLSACGVEPDPVGARQDRLALPGVPLPPPPVDDFLPPHDPEDPPPPPDLLVAHYAFDGNALDSGPNHLDGLSWFVDPTTDRHGSAGKALRFHGALPYYSQVRVDEEAQFDFPNDFTLSVFVRVDAYPPHIYDIGNWGEAYIVGKDPETNYRLSLRHYGGSSYLTPSLLQFTASGGWVRVEAPADRIAPGSGWHHIAGVRSGSTLSLYVDGVLRSSSKVGPPMQNNKSLWIGAPPPSLMTNKAGVWTLDGALDDLKIYRRALSSIEIAGIPQTALSK